MNTSAGRSRVDRTDYLESVSPTNPRNDILAQITDRVGTLYAEEERRDRIERTELMIRKARAQLQ